MNVFKVDFGFLDKCDDLQLKLKFVEKWLEVDMERCKNCAWAVVVPLYLNNKILKAYYSKSVQKISEQLVPKKILERMDPEDFEDVLHRVSNTTDFGIFIKELRLDYYFGKLVNLFKQ